MMTSESGWDYLLSLDGVTMVVDEKLGFWVKFVARRESRADRIPHGVRYSLTLHNRSGRRMLGFDNAHPVGTRSAHDHWHRSVDDAGRKYTLESPEQLLADFWREVERVLKEHADD